MNSYPPKALVGGGTQIEQRDDDAEALTFCAFHQIAAFHTAFESTEDAKTVVFVHLARRNRGLFTYNAIALYLLHLAIYLFD